MKPFYVRSEGISHGKEQDLLDLAVDAGAVMHEHRNFSKHHQNYNLQMDGDWEFLGVNESNLTSFEDDADDFGTDAVEMTYEEAWDCLQGLINGKGGGMKKEDFLNTKWDARDWTEDMKRKWQERMFELGFCFAGRNPDKVRDCEFYYLNCDFTVTHGLEVGIFIEHPHTECTYSFAFPEMLTDQGQSDTETPTATDLLNKGAGILDQRGAEYEKDGNQERSFDSIAAAFNAITGKDLTPAEIALVLQCVKDVRQWSQDRLHEDSVIDGINYAALKGELLYKQYGE